MPSFRWWWIPIGVLAAFCLWQYHAREKMRKAGLPVGPWVWNPISILPRT